MRFEVYSNGKLVARVGGRYGVFDDSVLDEEKTLEAIKAAYPDLGADKIAVVDEREYRKRLAEKSAEHQEIIKKEQKRRQGSGKGVGR